MKIKFLILVTIFLVSSMLSTDAFSMAHDKLLKDLNKAAEQLNKDLDSNKIKENSKTSNNLNKNPDNLNNSKLEKKSSPVVQGKLDSEADNKFFRKAYY